MCVSGWVGVRALPEHPGTDYQTHKQSFLPGHQASQPAALMPVITLITGSLQCMWYSLPMYIQYHHNQIYIFIGHPTLYTYNILFSYSYYLYSLFNWLWNCCACFNAIYIFAILALRRCWLPCPNNFIVQNDILF